MKGDAEQSKLTKVKEKGRKESVCGRGLVLCWRQIIFKCRYGVVQKGKGRVALNIFSPFFLFPPFF